MAVVSVVERGAAADCGKNPLTLDPHAALSAAPPPKHAISNPPPHYHQRNHIPLPFQLFSISAFQLLPQNIPRCVTLSLYFKTLPASSTKAALLARPSPRWRAAPGFQPLNKPSR
jgi:hypothetical protein